jgi:hypothetical protein
MLTFNQYFLTIRAFLECTFVGGVVNFGRRANLPRENKDFFLKSCF